MNYRAVQKAMMKRAAAFPWKQWFTDIGSSIGIGGRKDNEAAAPKEEKTRSQAFHDLNVKPYDTAKDYENAGFDTAMAGDRAHLGALPSMYWNNDNVAAGHIRYTHAQGTPNNGTNWAYKIYMQRPGSAESSDVDSVNFNVYPEQLPNYRYGKQLNQATASYRQQPLTMQQLMAIQAGDNEYVDKILNHYKTILPEHWQAANLRLSSPDEIEKWKASVPGLAPAVNDSSNYNSEDNAIRLTSNNTRLSEYDSFVNNSGEDLADSPHFIAKPSTLRDPLFHAKHTPEAADADTFFHELNHRNSMGSARVVGKAPYQQGEAIPLEHGGIAALMQPIQYKGLYLTPEQIKWIQRHDIEPYAVNENEMNQALLSFNAGRYRLQKDMQENPDNPNYSQISPEVRQQFANFPQFIQPGEEGVKQLDELMHFYDQNPQFILMMPEQARLVGYYKNLKAAIANSNDQTEKEFFQGMLDRMIYNKAFLANHQSRPAMSYTDVQRMRA